MTNQEAATLLIELYSAYRVLSKQRRDFEEAVAKAIAALNAMDLSEVIVNQKLL